MVEVEVVPVKPLVVVEAVPYSLLVAVVVVVRQKILVEAEEEEVVVVDAVTPLVEAVVPVLHSMAGMVVGSLGIILMVEEDEAVEEQAAQDYRLRAKMNRSQRKPEKAIVVRHLEKDLWSVSQQPHRPHPDQAQAEKQYP